MSAFEDLKKKAEAQVAQDTVATQSWVKANRKPLLIGVAAMALVWIVAHHFGLG